MTNQTRKRDHFEGNIDIAGGSLAIQLIQHILYHLDHIDPLRKKVNYHLILDPNNNSSTSHMWQSVVSAVNYFILFKTQVNV